MTHFGAKPVSMGCLTAHPTCSICGEPVGVCDHTRPGTCDCDPDGEYECHGQGSCGAYEELVSPMLISVALVPAPKCDDCGEPMVIANNTEWMCEFEGCESKGVPKHMGIYPVCIS